LAKAEELGSAVLGALNLGYNGYTDPTATSPRQWAAASNVFSGLHGEIRRARWAPVVNTNTSGYSAQSKAFDSLFNFRDINKVSFLLGDINNKQFTFNIGSSYAAAQRFNPYVDPSGTGSSSMAGPWTRESMRSVLYEVNGTVKQTARGANLSTVESLGLDTPDASPSVTLSAGAITKSVGRSYAFAWENLNKFHVGAPSPATSYIAYATQQGTVKCVQAGTVATSSGTAVVTGTGTAFTSAWVGRRIWIDTLGGAVAQRIISVTDATHLTVASNFGSTVSAKSFAIYDQQSTHLRLYATADGGAVYFRTQRNAFVEAATSLSAAGLQFTDNDNSEPPNGNFTSEQAEFFNVPPPIGKYIAEYQSRFLHWGVAGALQTLFYSNIELTSQGNPPESYAPLNQVTFPIKDAEVRAVAGLPTGLIVWSDKQDMFKITGALTDNSVNTALQQGSTVSRLPYKLGAASATAAVTTPLGVIWLTSDLEVLLFTDHYAPRNIGRSVQDILSTINPARVQFAKMTYYKRADRNWVVLAIATGVSTTNNVKLILDLDVLASNGAPSYFIFDMATNQPTWYVYNVPCEGLTTAFDQNGIQHLLAGDTDAVRDVDWTDNFFTVTPGEQTVSSPGVTLHAWGNDTADKLKRLMWTRFITNQDPGTLKNDGWTFAIAAIDDDFYTFASPLSFTCLPEVNSPTLDSTAALGLVTKRAFEFSPALFKTQGINFIQGRRIKFTINFPTAAGKLFALRGIQFEAKES
jgi:hypothetical protein